MLGTETLVPASCNASVRWVLPDPVRVLAACKSDKHERPVELFGKGLRTKTPAVTSDEEADAAQLLADPFQCARYYGCFDARDGNAIDLHGTQYELRVDDTLIMSVDEGFASLDLRSKTYKSFPKKPLLGTGPRHVFAGDALIELASGKPLGKLPSSPLFLDASGRALTQVVEGDRDELPRGPFRWATVSSP